jgi:hypothetical protein
MLCQSRADLVTVARREDTIDYRLERRVPVMVEPENLKVTEKHVSGQLSVG